ncbi:MAG: hypothetical protein AB8B87_26940 [Granulosicoccus sp.]
MQQRRRASALLLLATLLAGCSTLKAPARIDYTGRDNVSIARTDQLIGTWSVSSLNPYPGVESQSTTIEYRENGTVRGIVIPQETSDEASQGTIGDIAFELTGNWELEEDVVIHRNITMKSTNDSAIGKLLSDIINSRPAIAGQANIYELSPDRIVMVGSDGNAMEYLRQ